MRVVRLLDGPPATSRLRHGMSAARPSPRYHTCYRSSTVKRLLLMNWYVRSSLVPRLDLTFSPDLALEDARWIRINGRTLALHCQTLGTTSDSGQLWLWIILHPAEPPLSMLKGMSWLTASPALLPQPPEANIRHPLYFQVELSWAGHKKASEVSTYGFVEIGTELGFASLESTVGSSWAGQEKAHEVSAYTYLVETGTELRFASC